MTIISKVAVGIAILCAAGYCYYFDKKRRSDPDFKKKLKERRKAKKLLQRAGSGPASNDPEIITNFYLEQLRTGQECMYAGELEKGIYHFVQAISVCEEPHKLLAALQTILPPPAYYSLLLRLQSVQQQTLTSKKATITEEVVD